MNINSFFKNSSINLVKKNLLHFDLFQNNNGNINLKKNETFKDTFFSLLSKVNDSQLDVSKITEKAILSPDSVDVHDVTILISKATMNLSMTKAIVERSIKAYQDIINIR